MYFDEEGGGPQRVLQGCIINGDTIGTDSELRQMLTETTYLVSNYFRIILILLIQRQLLNSV